MEPPSAKYAANFSGSFVVSDQARSAAIRAVRSCSTLTAGAQPARERGEAMNSLHRNSETPFANRFLVSAPWMAADISRFRPALREWRQCDKTRQESHPGHSKIKPPKEVIFMRLSPQAGLSLAAMVVATSLGVAAQTNSEPAGATTRDPLPGPAARHRLAACRGRAAPGQAGSAGAAEKEGRRQRGPA